jgi:cytochrome c
MDFLDKLVIAQPDYNLNLLNYFMIIGLSIFLIFSGTLFGSILLSVYFKGKSKSFSDKYAKLALDYAGLITEKPAYGFGLGIVPFLSIIFIYAQLLHKAEVSVVGFLSIAFLIYLAAVVMAFSYKRTLKLSKVFDYIGNKFKNEIDSADNQEVNGLNIQAHQQNRSRGKWSLTLFLISMWIFTGSVSLALNSQHWVHSSILDVLFSADSILQILQFITIAFSITAITFLFRKYYWDKDTNDDSPEYLTFARNANLWIALVSITFVPVFITISLFTIPLNSLNNLVLMATITAIFLSLIILQSLYLMKKSNDNTYIKYTFIAFFLIIVVFSFKDSSALGSSNLKHIVTLNKEYEIHKQEHLASLGLGEVKVNGSEIYNGRCNACHKAEDSPTAPAHKGIIGKYLAQSDPKAALIKFILSPVKVNPNWPPMPNQGLNPKEAEAVADYMLEKYGGKKAETPAPVKK